MLYKVVRGMVPAINADDPLRNKRNIKPRLFSDFQTTNFVQRYMYSVNYAERFKIPESKSTKKKVQVGKDQEKVQSEKRFPLQKPRREKPN